MYLGLGEVGEGSVEPWFKAFWQELQGLSSG